MSMPVLPLHLRSVGHRWVAALSVVLMLVLAVLSVRADWHEALCHHAHAPTHGVGVGHGHAADPVECTDHCAAESAARADADAEPTAADGETESCVIALFAQGHLLAVLILFLLGVVVWRHGAFTDVPTLLVPASVDCVWPHACGPPRS